MSKGPSAYQIATKVADEALAALSAHDDRIDEATAKLEGAKLANKNAVASTDSIEEATKIKAETAAHVSVLEDVLADLMTERELLVQSLTSAYEGMGNAEYDQAIQAFMEGMAELCKILKTTKASLQKIVAADKILSRGENYRQFNQVADDIIRVMLAQSGRKPHIPNNRSLDTFESILEWYDGRVYSTHSRKVAIHMQKATRWALKDRDSAEFSEGRMKYLQKKAKAKSAA